ncbi:hypothetical protein LZ32DRAFT_24065 [Colletotrichum eremochloae]|nr:hypothetical protein LZ32DRAFT_24065 [Colletotrichum eremochloae]
MHREGCRRPERGHNQTPTWKRPGLDRIFHATSCSRTNRPAWDPSSQTRSTRSVRTYLARWRLCQHQSILWIRGGRTGIEMPAIRAYVDRATRARVREKLHPKHRLGWAQGSGSAFACECELFSLIRFFFFFPRFSFLPVCWSAARFFLDPPFSTERAACVQFQIWLPLRACGGCKGRQLRRP